MFMGKEREGDRVREGEGDRGRERERGREERENKLSRVSSNKGTNPGLKAPPSCTHLTLITSQMSHLQILSYWRLGLQHREFGRNTKFLTETKV